MAAGTPERTTPPARFDDKLASVLARVRSCLPVHPREVAAPWSFSLAEGAAGSMPMPMEPAAEDAATKALLTSLCGLRAAEAEPAFEDAATMALLTSLSGLKAAAAVTRAAQLQAETEQAAFALAAGAQEARDAAEEQPARAAPLPLAPLAEMAAEVAKLQREVARLHDELRARDERVRTSRQAAQDAAADLAAERELRAGLGVQLAAETRRADELAAALEAARAEASRARQAEVAAKQHAASSLAENACLSAQLAALQQTNEQLHAEQALHAALHAEQASRSMWATVRADQPVEDAAMGGSADGWDRLTLGTSQARLAMIEAAEVKVAEAMARAEAAKKRTLRRFC